MRARKQFRIVAAGLVVALALVGAACGSDDELQAEVVATPAVATTEAATAEPVAETSQAVPTEVVDGQVGDAASIDTHAFPVVLRVEASTNDRMSWEFRVTLSSPYDTPERYADAWRVLDRNDVQLGIRVLGHDHASEQPFTRSQSGIQISEDAMVVFVEGRDQANGWSGQRFAFELSR